MPKLKRKLWFRLRLLFNKIRPLKYDLGSSILEDFRFPGLPWHPCTDTDTHFDGWENIAVLPEQSLKLSIRRSMLPEIVKCGAVHQVLSHSGACITTVDKDMTGRSFLYGRFDYKLKMAMNPNVVCAVWWLTETRMVEWHKAMVESILPEIDWPESSSKDSPGHVNVVLSGGVKYRQPGFFIRGNKFWSPFLFDGNYWMEWTPDKITFGFEDHVVATLTKDVPHEPMYPIIWIAVGKWGDGLLPEHTEYFEIQKFTYHK